MEYQVNLILTLWDKKKASYTTGLRKIKLSFPPFFGLSFIHGPFHFGEIKKIAWVEEHGIFSCSLDYVSRDDADEDLEFLVKMAKKADYEGFDEVYQHPKYS